MPARKRPHHNDSCREKIQTSQLLNRLQDHALGAIDLERTQIDAIKILLAKKLPDLSHVTHEGGEEPVKHVFGWMPVQS